MKKLRLQSLKALLPLIIIFSGIGIFFTIAMLPDMMKGMEGPIPLEEVDFSGDFKGLYVTTTLPVIYDYYCEETLEDEVVSREYIIDADDYYYMGLRVEEDEMAAADNLMNAYFAYLDGSDDGTLIYDNQYEVTGVITEMPEDSKGFYYETAEWYGADAATFLPYYIDTAALSGDSSLGLILFVDLLLFGFPLVFLLLALSGRYQKEVKKYINGSMNAELATARVENFLATTPVVNKMQYNHEFICGNNNGTTVFGETDKVVWAYTHVTRHKLYYLITISKSYCVVLGFADGTRQMAAVKNEAIAAEHLQNIQKLCPKAVFGYSDELERMFRKDFPQFLNMRYNAPEQTANTMEDNPVTDKLEV